MDKQTGELGLSRFNDAFDRMAMDREAADQDDRDDAAEAVAAAIRSAQD